MTTVYTLTSEVDGVLSTSLHTSLADVERCLRENFDSEPADYAILPLDELIESLEDRDNILLSIEEHELPDESEFNGPVFDQELLERQINALDDVLSQASDDSAATVTITSDQADLLESISILLVSLRR